MPVAAALRSQAAWSSRKASKSANTAVSHSGGVLKRRSSIGVAWDIAETGQSRKSPMLPAIFAPKLRRNQLCPPPALELRPTFVTFRVTTMAGYSGTPLPRKLGLKPGARFAVWGAPANFGQALGTLPEGMQIGAASRGSSLLDVIVCFASSRAELLRRLPRAQKRL